LKTLLGYSLTHETNFQFFSAETFIRVGELAQLFICYYRWNGRLLTKVRFFLWKSNIRNDIGA